MGASHFDRFSMVYRAPLFRKAWGVNQTPGPDAQALGKLDALGRGRGGGKSGERLFGHP